MKMKYIMAIGALGTTLAIVPPCTAYVTSWAATAPPGPTTAVWDGSDYVGQVNGKDYYLSANNTWAPLDAARQQRFNEWQKHNPNWNNPTAQSSQMQNTRSAGPVRGQNPGANPPIIETGQVPPTGQIYNWNDPSAQPNGIRNTRHQGHDMGQTRPVAPPLQEQNQ